MPASVHAGMPDPPDQADPLGPGRPPWIRQTPPGPGRHPPDQADTPPRDQADTSCDFHILFTFSDFFLLFYCVIEMGYAQRETKFYGLKFNLK